MLAVSRRFFYALFNKIRRKNPDNAISGLSAENLTINFSKIKKSPFDIKSENSYDAYLSRNKGADGSLTLALKKLNHIAWVGIPQKEYQDHVIEAKIRLDSLGGYSSAGIIFRIVDNDSYYMTLVSNKGYFRLDAVKNGNPKNLIGWTEISDFDGININLNIITYGTYLIIIVNGKWAGEINDDTISAGRLGFALASYLTSDQAEKITNGEAAAADKNLQQSSQYTCKAMLDYFSVDTRVKTVEEKYKKWTDESNINADCRLRLAETFAVMGKSSKALEQIKKAWKRRDEAIRSSSVVYTEVRTKKELLLATRMAFNLGQYEAALEYIDQILDQWPDSNEGKSAYTEKTKILNELNKFDELKDFLLKHPDITKKDINYCTMLARCHWELKEYKESAKAWNRAFRMNSDNAVYAVNAANALELTGKKDEALSLFLEAGRIFLKQDNKGELEAMMPKLIRLGSKNWEAYALTGKWAFAIEDYKRCIEDFTTAEKLRCAIKPRPKADSALFYLWGLVLSIQGKKKNAIRMLENAVKLAPEYGLFRFKLAEQKLRSGFAASSVEDPKLIEELKLALKYADEDMREEMANHAGNLLLSIGDTKNAEYFFNTLLERHEAEPSNQRFAVRRGIKPLSTKKTKK